MDLKAVRYEVSDRVGVIILLTPESGGEDRLQGIRREVLEPLDELGVQKLPFRP